MAARNLLSKILLSLLIFSVSCAHTTRMISVPAGAEIFVDGKKVGTAPMNFHQGSGTVGRSYQITAKMPDGRESKLKESVKICPTSANMILDSFLVGFLWGFCLRDEYVFDFTGAATQPSQGPG